MTWQDRIHLATYTPQSGESFTFDFEDVSRVTEKRTTAFNFIGLNESYVQDNGYGSRKYALRCFFTGDNHDLDATKFEAALLEFGVGKLEHPFYGTFDVVPFGTITRSNGLVRGGNQSVVDCTFWTTTGVVYPSSDKSPENEVLAGVVEYRTVSAEAYEDRMDVDGTTKQVKLRGTVNARLATINETLAKPAATTTAVLQEFRAWQLTINRSINTLVGQPLLLAEQMFGLIQAPARAAGGIANRLVGYANYFRATAASVAGTPWLVPGAAAQPRRQTQIANDWVTADMTAMHALVAMALAAVNAEYRTRPEALSVAELLLSELDLMAAWRDQGYAAFTDSDLGSQINVVDDGRAWAAASNTIYRCAGFLVSLAFSLATERVIVLDRPRTVVDLCAELYGDVSHDTIGFLIRSNDLSGREILELPRGLEIVWYPT